MGSGRVGSAAWWIVGLIVLGAVALFLAVRRGADVGGALARGQAAYARRDWEGASVLARESLRGEPANAHALRLLARSSARLERDGVARNLYARLGAAGWEPEDHLLLGHVIDRAGDLNLAVKTWTLALSSAPEDPEVLDALASGYRRTGLLEAAEQFAERLARRPGWLARGAFLVGELQAEMNDPEAAVSAYRRSLSARHDSAATTRGEAPSPTEIGKRLARVLLRLGKPGEARTALEKVGLAPGRDLEADWLRARSELQNGDVAERAHERAAEYRAEHPVEPEPAPYVGSAACGQCHRAASRAVAESRHARTFVRAGSIDLNARILAPTPTNLPDPIAPARAVHTLKRDGRDIVFESKVGGALYRAIVDYAFGSGDRGLTFVGHDSKNRPRELRLSRYADPSGWDVTNGQDARPVSSEGYLGKVLTSDQARRCLVCHTTDPRSARDQTGPTASDRAIGCERCHGPGGHHKTAVENGLPDLAIAARPKGLSGPEVTRLCGQCHAVRGLALKPDNPYATRFQADTLTWSRCYVASDGALSCLTCHDPHRDAEHDPAFYTAKCLACHSSPKPTASTVCPVSPKTDCVRCHMPVERVPAVPHTKFTDHFIRVHRE